VLLAGLVTVTSIAGYAVLSFTINGLPLYPAAGWVAVLQTSTAPFGDTVQLLVQARADGSQTRAEYDVVVCGPRPYTGDLLIGGSARLATVLHDPVLPASVPLPRVQSLPDLVFYFGQVIDLGPVQLVHIGLPEVPACPAASAGQSSGTLPGGSAEGITGITSGPLQQSWAGLWGWWHGPHATQAWPLTGGFPGVPPGVSGTFVAVRGLSGSWTLPIPEYAQINAVDVPASWSVDSVLPAASGPYPLAWQSTTPIAPLARLTDSPALAQFQDWQVIFAVGLGIAGSMLASLLFEWLRPRPAHDNAGPGSRIEPSGTPDAGVGYLPPASSSGSRYLPALIGAIIVIGYARIRRARSRHS
jgi:hypothetical protein